MGVRVLRRVHLTKGYDLCREGLFGDGEPPDGVAKKITATFDALRIGALPEPGDEDVLVPPCAWAFARHIAGTDLTVYYRFDDEECSVTVFHMRSR